MNISITVNQTQLPEVLFNVAPVRPVFIWGRFRAAKLAYFVRRRIKIDMHCR
jgi:hypothetical protein